MTKKVRQAQIAELIEGEKIRSQQALLDSLERLGIRVTQATLSRDLAELGVVKGPKGYELIRGAQPEPREPNDMRRIVREFVRALEAAGNLVVLKTDPGNAHTVAFHIDRARWPEVIGTIAGDDTIFIAVRKPGLTVKVMTRIQEVMKVRNEH